MNPIQSVTSHLLDLLFPRRCPVCAGIVMPRGNLICPDCMKKLSWVHRPTCKKCGKEVISDTIEYCCDCTKHRRSFDYGLSLINYDDIAGRSMAQIKYNNKREYLDFYSEAMFRGLGKRILRMGADALVPVPVHRSRLRVRGFNQAEELAWRLSAKTGRLKNLEQAFTAGHIPPNIRSVILVDDIYTTGSTIEACTRVLKKAGMEHVYFVTIFIGHGQ